jgi:hypothetical protein
VGIARHDSDAPAGVGNIAKRQKEYPGVFVLQASIQILSRLVRILERLQ